MNHEEVELDVKIIAPGTQVSWESQAHGNVKRKEGTVIAYIPPNVDALDALFSLRPEALLLPYSRRKIQPQSIHPRYLVEVPRKIRDGGYDYYSPLASVLEKQNKDCLR